jgi:hypothetical protein
LSFGTLIEYDSEGKICWSWNSEKYFPDIDIYYSLENDENFIVDPAHHRIYDPSHINGFYLDEYNDILYISVKNMSRIIKLDRKTGKILACYGAKYPSGQAIYANGFFQYLHAPILLPDGNIMVFNNNNLEKSSKPINTSSVVIFSQPKSERDSSKKIWEFLCNFDSLYKSYSFRTGNSIFLENSDIIVNMGDPVSRIFQVTKDKKIVWDCYTEKFSIEKETWISSCNFTVFYSKSLYPVYFTVTNSFNPDTLKYQKNLKFEFILHNKGSSSDRYIVKYFVNNTIFKTYFTDEILPDRSNKIGIDFKKENISHQKINISINSISNPHFIRDIHFYVD